MLYAPRSLKLLAFSFNVEVILRLREPRHLQACPLQAIKKCPHSYAADAFLGGAYFV
jgi:hypothetical protein